MGVGEIVSEQTSGRRNRVGTTADGAVARARYKRAARFQGTGHGGVRPNPGLYRHPGDRGAQIPAAIDLQDTQQRQQQPVTLVDSRLTPIA